MKPSQWKQPLMAAMVVFIMLTISCSNMMDDEDKNSKGVAVVGVTLNKSATSIDVGSTEQLTATIDPLDATNKDLSWESSDEDIATVDSNGLVTAAAGGTATITVTTEDGDFSAECEVTANWVTGNKVTYTADNTTFAMVYVAGGYTFPTGESDSGTATVDNALWIGETEVTWELWCKIYIWATGDSNMNGSIGSDEIAGIYTLAHFGIKGNNGASEKSGRHPVSNISWRDAMVWSNALTEWYNENNGTDDDFDCVYFSNADYTSPIRTSTDSTTMTFSTAGSQDMPYLKAEINNNTDIANCTAKGFRLLTSNEWELSARWRNDSTNSVDDYSNPWFTKGNSASGAWTYNNDISDVNPVNEIFDGKDSNDMVAIYASYWDGDSWVSTGNSGTAEVKSKNSNALGLYDMSGNLREYCFEIYGIRMRSIVGGCFAHQADDLQIGRVSGLDPYSAAVYRGARIGRTE